MVLRTFGAACLIGAAGFALAVSAKDAWSDRSTRIQLAQGNFDWQNAVSQSAPLAHPLSSPSRVKGREDYPLYKPISPLRTAPLPNPVKGVPAEGIPLANTDRLRGQDAMVRIGTSKAVNAICGLRAMQLYRELAGTWGGDGFYAQEQKRVPKGTPFWLALEIQYGNKSGKPNIKGCPSNTAPLPSPLSTGACMAWWSVKRLAPSRTEPSVPDRRAECIQTKLIRLIGTGEKVGDLAVDLSPPVVSVEACKTVTLTARVTRAGLPGKEELVQLQWVNSSPNGLQRLPTLAAGPGGAEESRTFLAAQPGTHTIAAHYLGNSPGAKRSSAFAEVRVMPVAPDRFVVQPDPPPILTVGDRLDFDVAVSYGKKRECIPSPTVGQEITLTATGGTVEGRTFIPTKAGTAKVAVRYRDPASNVTLDRDLSVRVEDRSSLLLAVKPDKSQIGPCDSVTFTPTVTTKDGKALSGDRVRLGVDWTLQLDKTTGAGPRAVLSNRQALDGSSAGLTSYTLSSLGPGEHGVTATLHEGGNSPPSAGAKVVVRHPTPDGLEIQPRDFKIRKGAVLSFQGTVTFKDRCLQSVRLQHQDMTWRADRGKFQGDAYIASEAGPVTITASYKTDDQSSETAIDVAQFEVIDSKRKASVDASITRRAPK